MPWIGKLLGLITALGGFAAAYGFVGAEAQVLPPPTLSVTVPTLPVPPPPPPTVTVTTPVPVPPPPTLPAPVPPPPPPPAAVSSVTSAVTSSVTPPRAGTTTPVSTPGTSAGASGGAGAPSTSGPSNSSPSAGPAAWSGGEPAARQPTGRARQNRVEAKTQRSKNGVSVKLEFTLPEARRVFLIVRGPAPSCRIVGVIPFRGRKGENAASFAGRVRGRMLEPGVYLLTISPKRRLLPGAHTEYARVASPRRTVPLAESAKKPTCSAAQALAADPTARFLGSEPATAVAAPTTTARPAAPLRPPITPAPERIGPDVDDGGVLGALPSPGDFGSAARDSVGGVITTFVLLVLAGALLVGMLGLVARFMRGSWNP